VNLPSWWPLEAGRLAGFRYREIARKLKAGGFQFDRQAADSHEIWFNPTSNRINILLRPRPRLSGNPITSHLIQGLCSDHHH
jgi:predicted RNA binding protein YcfA (HicA-like mRNA interferase family)